MQKAGVKLALCTDHPVIPIQYLPTTAALAVKGGMQREDALYAITAGAAEILGVENRIGSIAAGMDADLQLYRGDPLDLLCDPWLVMINGRRVAADLSPNFKCKKGSVTAAAAACMPLRGIAASRR
ncbi:MAG: amidohydrolase family protein [Ruminococcus callidus]